MTTSSEAIRPRSTVPELGQLAEVRQRRWIVTELGMLVHGGSLPGRVERYFGSLIDRQVLLPIAG